MAVPDITIGGAISARVAAEAALARARARAEERATTHPSQDRAPASSPRLISKAMRKTITSKLGLAEDATDAQVWAELDRRLALEAQRDAKAAAAASTAYPKEWVR